MTEPRTGYRVFVGPDGLEPEADGNGDWVFTWVDRQVGVARFQTADRAAMVLVEGSGPDWFVTLRGRRIGVSVRNFREQLLAEAASASAAASGPTDVKATLPGLIVAVQASQDDEVEAGDPLLTIEAMKMQNEVRAPRAGRVTAVAVAAGETVSTGQLLLRIE
jgi:acetyl/propionyl-CoA carboxylase alpha subunit